MCCQYSTSVQIDSLTFQQGFTTNPDFSSKIPDFTPIFFLVLTFRVLGFGFWILGVLLGLRVWKKIGVDNEDFDQQIQLI